MAWIPLPIHFGHTIGCVNSISQLANIYWNSDGFYCRFFSGEKVSFNNNFSVLYSLFLNFNFLTVKDTRWEKAPSNKTPAFTKTTNMGIWLVGTSKQLSVRGYELKQNFQKKQWLEKLLCDRSILYSPFYLS